MDPIAIVLAIVAAGCGIACVWLALSRVRLLARADAAEAEVVSTVARMQAVIEHARAEAAAVRARAADDSSRLQARIDELAARSTGLQVEATRLSQQLAGAEELHQKDLARHEDLYRARHDALERQRQQMETELRARLAELNQKFQDGFDAIAAKTLKAANDEFLKRAEERMAADRQKSAAEMDLKKAAVDQLIRPISETLARTDAKLAELDKARLQTAASLSEQLKAAAESNVALREETGKLARALREPHVRGRYGELQLRRVAELAGMQAYCDFSEQHSTTDADGNALRPDMVVRLPSDRVVVVDAKTNIQAYLDALHAATPEAAEACLERFAKHVADQAAALARKKYWAQYDGSPEFVVMFIPGDQFIDAALSRQPDILENAIRQNVLLAGPSTLIGLLRAVAVGYKEQRLARAAQELRDLGVEFHERAAITFRHIARMGESLGAVVDRYNEFVGSYERRLEPTLRKFEEAGAGGSKEVVEVKPVDARPRLVGVARLPFALDEAAPLPPDASA
jgi:DNA recombination protein RmuC